MRISRADIPSVNFFNLKFRAAVQVLPLHEEHDKWSLMFLLFFFFFGIKLYADSPTSSRLRKVFLRVPIDILSLIEEF